MKKFAVFATVILIPAGAWADIITSPGAGFVSVPVTFPSTTRSGTAPFWNNTSLDGMNMNAGDFLGRVNFSLGNTDYLSSSGGIVSHLSTAASRLHAPTHLSHLQTAPSLDVQPPHPTPA